MLRFISLLFPFFLHGQTYTSNKVEMDAGRGLKTHYHSVVFSIDNSRLIIEDPWEKNTFKIDSATCSTFYFKKHSLEILEDRLILTYPNQKKAVFFLDIPKQ